MADGQKQEYAFTWFIYRRIEVKRCLLLFIERGVREWSRKNRNSIRVLNCAWSAFIAAVRVKTCGQAGHWLA